MRKITTGVESIKRYLFKLRTGGLGRITVDFYNASTRIFISAKFINVVVSVAGALRYQQGGAKKAGLTQAGCISDYSSLPPFRFIITSTPAHISI